MRSVGLTARGTSPSLTVTPSPRLFVFFILLTAVCLLPSVVRGQQLVDKMVATVNAGVQPDCRSCLITYSDLLWQLALQPDTPLANPTSETLNAVLRLVEVTCSDRGEHRRRVERRTLDGQPAPTWQQVLDRRYDAWTDPHLVVDNIGDPGPHIAEILVWVASRPEHVNIDELIVKPTDQASFTKIVRKPAK